MSQGNMTVPEAAAEPVKPPFPAAPSAMDLSAAFNSLSSLVQQVVRERDTYHKALETAQAERDEYRRLLYDVVRERFDKRDPHLTEEELKRMIAEEKWSPLEELIAEIEQGAQGS